MSEIKAESLNLNESNETYSLAVGPFVIFHVLTFVGLFFVEFSWNLVWLCVGMYYIRMFGITAGFHRYFSHRTFKTGRVFQFILALLGTLSIQKGVLWWAAHHRDHHKYSDLENDLHSPKQRGFWYSHCGWFLCHSNDETKLDRIPDFAKYPELIWLNEHEHLCATVFGVLMLALGGLPGLVYGFALSTVLLWHGTFTINSLSHVYGTVRYDTGDDSRNSLILALITMGEGWHNNHHYYQSSTNQGFFWWEIDMSYYILKALSWVGIVWGLRKPPEKALKGEIKAPLVARKSKKTRPSVPLQPAA